MMLSILLSVRGSAMSTLRPSLLVAWLLSPAAALADGAEECLFEGCCASV